MMPAQPDTGWGEEDPATSEPAAVTGAPDEDEDDGWGNATGSTGDAAIDPEPEETGADESTGGLGDGGDGSSSGGGKVEPRSLAPIIPVPTGACPALTGGMPELAAFETEDGLRDVHVYSDPEAGSGGPVVFFFHGSGGNPQQAFAGIGGPSVDAVLAMGGTVVAPAASGEADIEWFLTTGIGDADLRVMDEVVGCLHHEGPGIDPWQIHVVGFSAGALHASQASFRRNAYVASIVGYSGGLAFPGQPQVDEWVPPAMLFHGGADDVVKGFSFEYSTAAHAIAVGEAGGFCMRCDHQTGHDYPPNEVGVWRRADALNFLLDHRYGTESSAYEAFGTPSWVPPYCEVG